jgi:pimeloyl-ACP methyl ester carboxylesterase
LHLRGHEVTAVDLPCDDTEATLRDYAAVVPPADVVVGHSLGGLTIPLVKAAHRVYLCAFVPRWGHPTRDLFAEHPLVPGFPDHGITRDERGRSVWVDEAFALSAMYPDVDLKVALQTYALLRPQASHVYEGDYPLKRRPRGKATSIIGSHDAAISPEWSRRVAPKRLGVEVIEIPSGHSPMLSRPSDLANLLDELV